MRCGQSKSLYLLVFLLLFSPVAATGAEGTFIEALWDETITLQVDVTPQPGHQPVYQWLLASMSTDDTVYVVTPDQKVALAPDIEMADWTYPFTAQPMVQAIGDVKLQDFGLAPGDRLFYAYAYATQPDLQAIIIGNIVTVNIRAKDISLAPFGSDQALADYLKAGLTNTAASYGGNGILTPWASGGADDSGGSSGSTVFSTTNVQETGVDEADIIKSDGYYLYVVSKNSSGDNLILPQGGGSGAGDTIRILSLSEDPAQAVEAGTLALTDHTEPVDGIYLVTDRGAGLPDLLVTVGGGTSGFGAYWADSWYWQDSQTEIGLYSLDTPSQPTLQARLTFDGSLVASRRIGEVLYLVTRFTPLPKGFQPYPYDAAGTQKNEAVLDKAALAELMPGWSLTGTDMGSLVDAGGCYVPPYDGDKLQQPDIITLTVVPLAAPETLTAKSVAGPTETVYMSTSSLFLATTRYDYSGVLPMNDTAVSTSPAPDETDIHQFDLDGAGIVYRGSGTVLGNLGWETEKRPFRFSQHEGVLRVATSEGNTWDLTAKTRLTLLQPQQADPGDEPGGSTESLVTLSYVGDIGEVGERLYAVRYVGDRAYLITFRATDPLYVFDLADPLNPKELGELHINGYADYLHMVDENHLLGIGKDAVPDTGDGDLSGAGAWFQGVKLSLFDVSDPSQPDEIDKVVLGLRGTESDALYNHHAVTFLPPTDTSPARLALPMRLHTTLSSWGYDDPADPWYYYDWTHTGLYLFDIYTGLQEGSPAGLTSLGVLKVADAAKGDEQDTWWSWGTDRSLVLGTSIHYIHNSQVWSAGWDTPDNPAGPQ